MKETRRIEFLFEIFRILVALIIAYGVTLLCIMIISDDRGVRYTCSQSDRSLQNGGLDS